MTKGLRTSLLVLVALVLLAVGALAYIRSGEPRSPVPPVVTPGIVDSAAPSDAILLFDGRGLDQWTGAGWAVLNGALTIDRPGSGRIETRQTFRDYQLHIEWRVAGSGGDSAILLASTDANYVLQITGQPAERANSLVGAARPLGQWQTYDLIWTAPRSGAEAALQSPARLTAFSNGVLVRNRPVIKGESVYRTAPIGLRVGNGPNPPSFRNIWVRRL